MHDIHVAVAKHYVENLKEEVKKGMREKAEEGIYPGRAPIGYRNNSLTRSIDVDPERAPMVKRIFELYASGEHSLITLRRTVLNELGLRLSRSYFDKILKNHFYLGYFLWQGVEYKGTHEPLVSGDLFNRVQDVFAGRNKPKHRKHAFAFAGLLKCAHDGCTVTAELQKSKYVYYRCSHGRGKCSLPYMREQEVSDRMGELLKDIYVPETLHTLSWTRCSLTAPIWKRNGKNGSLELNSGLRRYALVWIRCMRTNWTAKSMRSSGRAKRTTGGNKSASWRTTCRV
jgi:hypothetical protein